MLAIIHLLATLIADLFHSLFLEKILPDTRLEIPCSVEAIESVR